MPIVTIIKNKFSIFFQTFSLITKIYNPIFILIWIIFFFAIYSFPYKFIPDYFHLNSIENIRTFIWSLFTITLGFSGLILTVLLVSYNFYLKSTRRQTLEFIFENRWLKIIFSSFCSIILLQLLSFCLIPPELKTEKLSSIYFLLSITGIYILGQFPLVILCLKYSTSMHRIKKILREISKSDIDYLYNPNKFLVEKPFEEIEKNKIILLKDLGVNALKEGDWVLPQSILNGLYDRVTNKINLKSIGDIFKEVYCFLFVCKHFQKIALKNSDHILIKVVYSYTLSTYHLLIKNKIRKFPYSQIDNFFKDQCFQIIQSNHYADIKGNIIKDYVDVIKISLKSLSYTDEELPTAYLTKVSQFPGKEKRESNADATAFWHYLIHYQLDVLKEILYCSISNKAKNVYDYFSWKIHELFYKSDYPNLTEAQFISYADYIFYSLDKVSFFAIENKITDNINIVSSTQIQSWIKEKNSVLYRSALYYYRKLLFKISAVDDINLVYLDDFFMIGRVVASMHISKEIKENVLIAILEVGIKLFKNKSNSENYKYELQKQLKWLFSIILEVEELKALGVKYKSSINEITKDFDFMNFPD